MIEITFDEIQEHIDKGDLKEWANSLRDFKELEEWTTMLNTTDARASYTPTKASNALRDVLIRLEEQENEHDET